MYTHVHIYHIHIYLYTYVCVCMWYISVHTWKVKIVLFSYSMSVHGMFLIGESFSLEGDSSMNLPSPAPRAKLIPSLYRLLLSLKQIYVLSCCLV